MSTSDKPSFAATNKNQRRLKDTKKKTAAETCNPQKSPKADDRIDQMQYRESRMKYVASLKAEGIDTSPHKFETTMKIPDYGREFEFLSDSDHLNDINHRLAGRIMRTHSSSPKLFFYDLEWDGARVQVVADKRKSDMDGAGFYILHANIKRGDIVGVSGFPGKTKSGQLSIFSKTLVVLSYCLHMLPDTSSSKRMIPWVPGCVRNPQAYVLKDQETRYRHRHLDLICNRDIMKIFRTRQNIITYVRTFVINLGFLEVETPILNIIPGGAAARPFVTHHNELNMNVSLRISPELYLKQFVVGGLDGVFEIGKQFRNEGIDLTHNPEFTTCEFYKPDADYNDLMNITEEMLSGLVKEITGGYKIKYSAEGPDKDPIEIDFTPPFRRYDMIKDLEKEANLEIPKDLSGEEANKYLAEACLKFDIKCPPPLTTSRLLDKLVGHFLEVKCVNPSFIMNHPEIMSPLAKWHRDVPGLTERFELFVNKHELVNAYTELNESSVQRQRFVDQRKDRECGDDEAMVTDEAYCTALEVGLAPTGGWGLGIDRLVMILTDSQNIQEVISFPLMKPRHVVAAKAT